MKPLRFCALLTALMLALLAATGSAWADGPDRTCPESCVEPIHPSGPWIVLFKATPKGETVTLTWNIANCGSDCKVSLRAQDENNHAQSALSWSGLAARGSLKVTPQANVTRYILTAVSPLGKARQSLVYARHGK